MADSDSDWECSTKVADASYVKAIAKTREDDDHGFGAFESSTQIVGPNDPRYSQVIQKTREPAPPQVPLARGTPLPASVAGPEGRMQRAAAAAIADARDDHEIELEVADDDDLAIEMEAPPAAVVAARPSRRWMWWIVLGLGLGGGIAAAMAAIVHLS